MKVAIDAGHGSNTAGKRTPDGYREHYANVRVAHFFAKAMERCGIEYIKTGWNDEIATDDEDTALSTRQLIIKNAKCDYSVSFHFNAYSSGWNSASGIETHISDKAPKDSLRLANLVQAQLIKGTVQKNRGVKKSALAMCNCNSMNTKASILIECGFMTNKAEAELMKSDVFCKECAEETARGFCEYLNIPYKEEDTYKLFDIRIRILGTVAIKNSPSLIGKTLKKINSGVYTIVKTNGNYGYLKSGAGWIDLSDKNVKKL